MKKIALIGNPNSGKTSLFNLLTGSNQRVGNWLVGHGCSQEWFFEKRQGNRDPRLTRCLFHVTLYS